MVHWKGYWRWVTCGHTGELTECNEWAIERAGGRHILFILDSSWMCVLNTKIMYNFLSGFYIAKLKLWLCGHIYDIIFNSNEGRLLSLT